MKWNEAYATGIPQIDEQHKRLFTMSDDYRISLDEGKGEKTYGMLLEFLERYARAHFGFEERCMEQYHCPAAEKNKEAHAKFTETLGEFRERYAEKKYQAADARELVDTLDHWLSGHIMRIDVALKEAAGKE